MDRVIIYGMGGTFRELRGELPQDINIVAYADSDNTQSTSLTGTLFEGIRIISKEEMLIEKYDYIYICTTSDNAWYISEDLCSMGVDKKKIKYLYRSYYDGIWNAEVDEEGNVIHDVEKLHIRERKGNKSDFQTISELLCTNCYSMDIPKPDTVVIDMGMNIGMASLLFASNMNVCKIYSFEPFKDTFDAALYNFSLNPELSHKICPFNVAVYDRDEEREIRVLTEFAGGRTTEFELIESNTEDKGERRELIKYRKASKIIGDIIHDNNGHNIVMKIDTEGAEFEIFKDLEKNDIFGYVNAIMMEYHRNPAELLDCLRKFGYVCVQNGHKNLGMIYAINMRNGN